MSQGNVRFLKLLLSRRANWLQKDLEEMTPLHLATRHPSPKALALLLKHIGPGEVDTQDKNKVLKVWRCTQVPGGAVLSVSRPEQESRQRDADRLITAGWGQVRINRAAQSCCADFCNNLSLCAVFCRRPLTRKHILLCVLVWVYLTSVVTLVLIQYASSCQMTLVSADLRIAQ